MIVFWFNGLLALGIWMLGTSSGRSDSPGPSAYQYTVSSTGTVTDIDGNHYQTATIGTQEWMIENLRTSRFNDGQAIPRIVDGIEWAHAMTAGYTWYDDDHFGSAEYGALYNWFAVHTGKLCPKGWRVPSDQDWRVLFDNFGQDPSQIFKGLNNAGFAPRAGGYRYGYFWGRGVYNEQGSAGYWWTSDAFTTTHAWSRTISREAARVFRSYFVKNNGFSVRCIKCIPPSDTVVDIDGNSYRTVVIGEQRWMRENLKTTRFNDGTPMSNVPSPIQWRHTDHPAYVWYENDPSNKTRFGALYNGYAATSGKLCPAGWRVASDDDWKRLESYLGMSDTDIEGTGLRGTNEGGRLKEAGNGTWQGPNLGASDDLGMAVVPGGRRDSRGTFSSKGTGATIWTGTETSGSTAFYRHFATKISTIGRNPEGDKKFGLAVRCVQCFPPNRIAGRSPITELER